MPNAHYPGAVWNPGVAAGYSKGRSTMRAAICHFTVGVDSTGVGKRGYFNWLVARDGTVQAFAEADALTWHAGTANDVGPGIEIEFLPGVDDNVFTDAARGATSGLIHWLESEWGIPLDYYDGDRIAPSRMRGFVSHRSVQQPDAHSDWWPQEDWDRMVAGAPVPGPLPTGGEMWLIEDQATLNNWLYTGTEMILVPPDHVFNLVAAGITRYSVNTNTVQWLGETVAP